MERNAKTPPAVTHARPSTAERSGGRNGTAAVGTRMQTRRRKNTRTTADISLAGRRSQTQRARSSSAWSNCVIDHEERMASGGLAGWRCLIRHSRLLWFISSALKSSDNVGVRPGTPLWPVPARRTVLLRNYRGIIAAPPRQTRSWTILERPSRRLQHFHARQRPPLL
jgi:hypothetical protein